MEKNYTEKEQKIANDVSTLSAHIYTSLKLTLDVVDDVTNGLNDSAKNPDEYPSIDSNKIANILRKYNVIRKQLIELFYECESVVK